jgi:drug/metabolite transporter (DMT)-like permease
MANTTLSFLMAAPKKTLVIVAFVALYLIWGSTYLGIRLSIETIPPFLMAGARFVLAGLIMYAIAWSQGIGKSTWANWRTSLIIGACLLLGGNGGVTISEQFIDSGLAALVVAIVPIYIVLLGWITGMARRPTPVMWMGLAGGFLGVAVLFGPGLYFHSVGGRNPAIGISILLVTSFIWSAGSLYSTNDLWRNVAFGCRRRYRRTAALSLESYFNVIVRLIYLPRVHRSRGRIHRLYLAAASL